jgi:hypothetical protein
MSQTIRILAAPSDSTPVSKGVIARSPSADTVLADVDLQTLAANLAELRAQVGQLFADAEGDPGFQLKQVTAGIEINAEGGVSLIGSLKAGAKAAITLTFERA